MASSRWMASGAFLGWASRLRFPTLFALTAGLFLLDLVVPDFIPIADELLLGLATLLLGTWKKRRKGPSPDSPPIDIRPEEPSG